MSEKKLTDEEIVKAFECCTHEDILCDECPIGSSRCYPGGINAMALGLDLIKRQKADLEFAKNINHLQIEELQSQKAEIERLREVGEQMIFPNTFDEFAKQYKIIDTKEVYTNGTDTDI